MRSRWPEYCLLLAVGGSLAYWLHRAPLATVWLLLGALAVGACGFAALSLLAKAIQVWKEWRDLQNG